MILIVGESKQSQYTQVILNLFPKNIHVIDAVSEFRLTVSLSFIFT